MKWKILIVFAALVIWNCSGSRGPKGANGGAGLAGADGADGLQGVQGEQGLPGADGDDISTTMCFSCHSDDYTDATANKIKWAQAGYDESVHKNGFQVPIWASYYDGANVVWYTAGYEWEGSDAFYANGQGCQVCHTREGFQKKIAGGYGSGGIISGAMNLATTHNDADVNLDSITNPTPLDCFGCHQPHSDGDFAPIVPDGTQITTEAGGVYDKPKGSLCASCHVVRLGGQPTVNKSIMNTLKTSSSGMSFRTGPHHGPQADSILGTAGATWDATVVGPYNNGSHYNNDDANCITCHMASDWDNLSEPLRYGLSPAVGGHSMAIVGIVHGAPTANQAGCTGSGCHANAAAKQVNSGNNSGFTGDDGWVKEGSAYVTNNSANPGTSSSDTVKKTINGLLKLLADPDNDCAGLLTGALAHANVGNGKTITWEAREDSAIGPICNPTAFTGGVAVKDNTIDLATSDTTDPTDNSTAQKAKINFGKAWWNFMLVAIEDRSFGVHNAPYMEALLYDSCVALKDITGGSEDCTAGGLYTRPAP